jgi:ATP-dependent helicase/nuclease subunit B
LSAMAEGGGFNGLDAEEVARVVYVGLKAELKLAEITLDRGDIDEIWAEFGKLMGSYARPTQGYTARRAMEKTNEAGDYDHLSRFGEWNTTDDPVPEDLA